MATDTRHPVEVGIGQVPIPTSQMFVSKPDVTFSDALESPFKVLRAQPIFGYFMSVHRIREKNWRTIEGPENKKWWSAQYGDELQLRTGPKGAAVPFRS